MKGFVTANILAASTGAKTAVISSLFDRTSKLLSASVELTNAGGCGRAKILATRALSTGHSVSAGNLIDVYVQFVRENGTIDVSNTRIYRGIILDITEEYGTSSTMTIEAVGLFHQFTTIPVVLFDEANDVDNIVSDLFTNQIYLKTWCLGTTSQISIASPEAIGDVEFTFTPADEAIRKLASVQGDVAFGVDEQARFFFKDQVTTQQAVFQIGLNAFDVKKTIRSRDLVNALFIRMNHVISSGSLIRFVQDATSVAAYKQRAKVVTAPEFKDPDDVETWADNVLAQTKDPIEVWEFEARHGLSTIQKAEGTARLVDADGATTLADTQVLGVTYEFDGSDVYLSYTLADRYSSGGIGSEIADMKRKMIFIENAELSNARIEHTGYEEFKQYVQENAMTAGKYNFMMTEFEEDAV